MCDYTYANGKPAIEIKDVPETATTGDFKTVCKLCGEEVSQVFFHDY